MRVMITGGAGFIGSNTARRFMGRGHQVLVFDNLSRKGCTANLEWLRAAGEFTLVQGDVRDGVLLRNTLAAHGPFDAIIHLAGQVAVSRSVVDPCEDFEINALGTLNVLEAARQSDQPPAILYASTNKVYGSLRDVGVIEEPLRYRYADRPMGIAEEQPLDFHSPYGCSKGAGDQYVRDYARIYGLRTVVFRQSCIYGYRQFGVEDQGWVAWFLIASALGKPITLYGDGKQVRDILFVDDLVDAYERALGAIDRVSGCIFNVGGGPANRMSLLELLARIEQFTGKAPTVTVEDWRPGDQRVYVSDIRKARAELGWEPATGAMAGVAQLYQWVTDNRETLSRLF